jgi:hypothetical protein
MPNWQSFSLCKARQPLGIEVGPGSNMGTRGRGEVGNAAPTASRAGPFRFVAMNMSCGNGMYGKVPTSPRPPLYLRRHATDDAHSIAPAKHFNFRPVAHGYDIHPMALEGSNIETLPENASDPAIRDRPLILEAVPFDEHSHDIGHGNYRPMRIGHELREDLQHLGLDQQTPVRDETKLRLQRDGPQLGSQICIGNNTQKRNQNLI